MSSIGQGPGPRSPHISALSSIAELRLGSVTVAGAFAAGWFIDYVLDLRKVKARAASIWSPLPPALPNKDSMLRGSIARH